MKQIDWNIVIEILKSLSIIIASGVAIFGVNSWRREVKWKRKYELAEEVLSLFYEVQEAISIIRSPFGYVNEGSTRKRVENEKAEDTEILDRAYTIVERFEANKEPFHKLRAMKYRFISVFGKESETPFNDIVKLTNKIMMASNFLGRRYWRDQGRKKFTDEQFQKHLEKMEEFETVIWEGYEDDEIKNQLNDIIIKIEKICNAVLKKK